MNTTKRTRRKPDINLGLKLESMQVISDKGRKVDFLGTGGLASRIGGSSSERWLHIRSRHELGMSNILIFVPAWCAIPPPAQLMRVEFLRAQIQCCELGIVRRAPDADERDSALVLVNGYVDNARKMRLRFIPALLRKSCDYVTAELKQLLPDRVIRAALNADWAEAHERLRSKAVVSIFSKDNILMGQEEQRQNELLLTRYACDEVVVLL